MHQSTHKVRIFWNQSLWEKIHVRFPCVTPKKYVSQMHKSTHKVRTFWNQSQNCPSMISNCWYWKLESSAFFLFTHIGVSFTINLAHFFCTAAPQNESVIVPCDWEKNILSGKWCPYASLELFILKGVQLIFQPCRDSADTIPKYFLQGHKVVSVAAEA